MNKINIKNMGFLFVILISIIQPIIGYFTKIELVLDLTAWVPIGIYLLIKFKVPQQRILIAIIIMLSGLFQYLFWQLDTENTHATIKVFGIIGGSFIYGTIFVLIITRYVFKYQLFESKKEVIFTLIICPIVAILFFVNYMWVYSFNLSWTISLFILAYSVLINWSLS